MVSNDKNPAYADKLCKSALRFALGKLCDQNLIVVMKPATSLLLLKHQLLHFLLILFFIFKIEHGSKNMIPNSGTYAITIMFVLVVMKMMISPKGFHPFKWRVPCMYSIMHGAIHKIAQKKTGEEHKCILPEQ